MIWRDDRGRRVARPLLFAGDIRQLRLVAIDGELQPIGASELLDVGAGIRVTIFYTGTAHLNHDPGDSSPRNLAALCQRCHMRHDAPEHRRSRWWNVFRLGALRDLFALRAQ